MAGDDPTGRDVPAGPGGSERDDEPASTPFDHPFFLPVLLWAFALWFGYDAFFNADEHMQDEFTLWFNRIGFPIVALLALHFTVKAVRENRAAGGPGDGGDPSTRQ